MIQKSHRLWPSYYSRSKNKRYRGYKEDWYSNNKYQFNTYQGDDDGVFQYDPVDQNINLVYIPIDTVHVDIAHTPRG